LLYFEKKLFVLLQFTQQEARVNMLAPSVTAILFTFLSFNKPTLSATPDQWASKSIYQVLTDRFALGDGSSPPYNLMRYCGGTWRGIINKLDYIQGMGFSAIQISPVVKNFANHTIHSDAFYRY
jgi:alpha-amylase